MNHKIAILLLMFAASPASAAVIHKWVDDRGVTHYSDEAPSADSQATKIDLPESGPAEGRPSDDYYSIANQWARLHKERLEREKIRLQEEQAKVRQKPAVTNIYVEEENKKGYPLIFRKPRHKKHYHKYGKKKINPNPGYTYRYYQSKYPPGLHPGRKVGTRAVGKTN